MNKYASWTHGKLPLPELLELKRRGQKLAMVTAYDAAGRLSDRAAAGSAPSRSSSARGVSRGTRL